MVITFGVLKTPFASDIGGDRYFNAEMVMWIMMCQHSLISLVSRVSSCPNSQPEGFSSGGGGYRQKERIQWKRQNSRQDCVKDQEIDGQ